MTQLLLPPQRPPSTRRSFIRLAVAAVAFCGAKDALACFARLHWPKVDEPERYRQIFWARVKSFELDNDMWSGLDLTPAYTLTLLQPTTLLGPTFEGDAVHIASGCGWPWPEAGGAVIVFAEKSGFRMVMPMYTAPDSNLLRNVIEEVDKYRASQPVG
jgi:hypothetical protein